MLGLRVRFRIGVMNITPQFDTFKTNIVAVTTKRQISRFFLSKDELFPLFWLVISGNGKIIWRLVVTSTIFWKYAIWKVSVRFSFRYEVNCCEVGYDAVG